MKYVIEIEKTKTFIEHYEFNVGSKEEMYKILEDKHTSVFGKCLKKSVKKVEEHPIRKISEEQ